MDSENTNEQPAQPTDKDTHAEHSIRKLKVLLKETVEHGLALHYKGWDLTNKLVSAALQHHFQPQAPREIDIQSVSRETLDAITAMLNLDIETNRLVSQIFDNISQKEQLNKDLESLLRYSRYYSAEKCETLARDLKVFLDRERKSLMELLKHVNRTGP